MSKRASPYKCSCGACFHNGRAVMQHIADKHKANKKQFAIYEKVA